MAKCKEEGSLETKGVEDEEAVIEQELRVEDLSNQFSTWNMDWPCTDLDAPGLVQLLQSLRYNEPFFITADTFPRVKKYSVIKGVRFENPWFGGPDKIVKRSRLLTRSRPNYAKEVKRMGQPFLHPIKPRKWGQRLKGTPFVVHMPRGSNEMRMYLEVVVDCALEHQYFLQGTEEKISSSQLRPFLSHSRFSSASSPVVWRDYDVRNIVSIEVHGQRFRIASNLKIADLF